MALTVLILCHYIYVKDKKTYVSLTYFRDAVSQAVEATKNQFIKLWYPAIIVNHSAFFILEIHI